MQDRQVVKLIRYSKIKTSANGTAYRRVLIETQNSEFKWLSENADNPVFKVTEWEGLCYFDGEGLSPLSFSEQADSAEEHSIAGIADELTQFVKLLSEANPSLSEDAIIRLAIAGHITYNKRA